MRSDIELKTARTAETVIIGENRYMVTDVQATYADERVLVNLTTGQLCIVDGNKIVGVDRMAEGIRARMEALAKRAVLTFGATAQMNQATEEFAEFIAALNHSRRKRDGFGRELIEEVCDSIILAKQLEVIYEEDMWPMIEMKLDKLEKQIKENTPCEEHA